MKRLKLFSACKKTYGVDCRHICGCDIDCPLFKIVGGYPYKQLVEVDNGHITYGECAVALVYAKFFGLY